MKAKRAFEKARASNKHALELLPVLRDKLGDKLPPVIGVPIFGDVLIFILDSSTSQQFFIDKNKFTTKDPRI